MEDREHSNRSLILEQSEDERFQLPFMIMRTPDVPGNLIDMTYSDLAKKDQLVITTQKRYKVAIEADVDIIMDQFLNNGQIFRALSAILNNKELIYHHFLSKASQIEQF